MALIVIEFVPSNHAPGRSDLHRDPNPRQRPGILRAQGRKQPTTHSVVGTRVSSIRLQLHLTVFMVTHDIDTLRATTDRIAVLVKGKLTVGTIASLRDAPNPWFHEYFAGVRGRAALAA